MSVLKANLGVCPQDLFASSVTQGTDLGAYATTGDGRVFRYALNGAVIAVPGQVYQGPANDSVNWSPAGGLAVAAAAIGTFKVTLTSSLTIVANALAGGYLSVAVTPGQGYNYKIASNTGVTAATGAVITLEDPIQVALTTASRVVLHASQFNGTIVAPATLTSTIVGIPVFAIPAASYGWFQTHGPASALLTGTFATAGLAVGVLVGGTIGSLAPAIAGTNVLGYTMGIGATGEYDHVFLNIN